MVYNRTKKDHTGGLVVALMKTRVEIFNDQDQAANRIDNLKQSGFHDADMFLIAKGEERIDNIRGSRETLADDQAVTSTSFWDRFRRLTGGREEFHEVFERMGMDEDLSAKYTEAVENGKILLVVASDNFE